MFAIVVIGSGSLFPRLLFPLAGRRAIFVSCGIRQPHQRFQFITTTLIARVPQNWRSAAAMSAAAMSAPSAKGPGPHPVGGAPHHDDVRTAKTPLNDGRQIPSVGLGVYLSGAETYSSVREVRS